MEKLRKIQCELEALKDKRNEFGKFNYRNIETMLAKIKPLLENNNCSLNISDELVEMGGRIFVRSTARFFDVSNSYSESSVAYAAIDFTHKGMSEDQCTGAAITYANKYAVCNLFLIDDGSGDPDAFEPKKDQAPEPQPKKQKPQPAPSTEKNIPYAGVKEAQKAAEEAKTVEALQKVWFNMTDDQRKELTSLVLNLKATLITKQTAQQ